MVFDDHQIIQRAVAGDPCAFTRLAEGVHGPLIGYLVRTVGNRPEVQDLGQEVLLRVYRGIGRFDWRRAHFSTWFFTIATNVCRDYLRRKKRFQGIADQIEPRPETAPLDLSPPNVAVRRDEIAGVEKALTQISDEQREVVVLRLYQGLTFREIGKVTGTSKDTAKSRMRYGLEKLRKILCEEDS